jgi:mlo protein
MGSTMKQSIFDEQTSKALKNWRAGVKKKAPTSSKHGGHGGSPAGCSPRGGSPTKADAEKKNAAHQQQGDAAGTGLQAGAAKKAAAGQQEGEYEFIKIDE